MANRTALANSLRVWLSQSNVDLEKHSQVDPGPQPHTLWSSFAYSLHPAFPARLLYCFRGGLALAAASTITLVLRRSPDVYRYLFTPLLVVVALTSTAVTVGASLQVALSITLVAALLCGLAVAIIACFAFADGSLAVVIPALGVLSFVAMLLPVNIAGVRLGLAVCAVALLSWYRNNLLQLPSPLYQPILQAAGLSIGCTMGVVAASLPLPHWPTAARESRLRMCISANSIRCRIGALAIAFTHVSAKGKQVRSPSGLNLTETFRRRPGFQTDKGVSGPVPGPAAKTKDEGEGEGIRRQRASPPAPVPSLASTQAPLRPHTTSTMHTLRRAASACDRPPSGSLPGIGSGAHGPLASARMSNKSMLRGSMSVRSMVTATDLASVLEDDLELEDMPVSTAVHGSPAMPRWPSLSSSSECDAATHSPPSPPATAPLLEVTGSAMDRISEEGLEASLATASAGSPSVNLPPVGGIALPRPNRSGGATTTTSLDRRQTFLGGQRPPPSRFESSSGWALVSSGGGGVGESGTGLGMGSALPERLPLLRADIEDLEEQSTREHAELRRALDEMVWELHSGAYRRRMNGWAEVLHRLNRITRSMVVAEMALRSSPLHGAFVEHVGDELCLLCKTLGECLLSSIVAGCTSSRSQAQAGESGGQHVTAQRIQQDFLRRRQLHELSATFLDTFQRARMRILYEFCSTRGRLPWRAVDMFALHAYILTLMRAAHVVLGAPLLEATDVEHGTRRRLDSDATVVEISTDHRGPPALHELQRSWGRPAITAGEAMGEWIRSFNNPSHSALKQATKVALAVMLAAGLSAALIDVFGDRDVLFWSAVTASVLAGGSPGGVYRTSALRLIGTLVGAMAGLIFGAITDGSDIGIAISVTLWCAILQYPRLSPSGNGYWATVAAITLPIVLIGLGPSTEALAAGRIRQTVLGILCFLAVSTLLWPVSARSLLETHSARVLRQCAQGISLASGGIIACLGEDKEDVIPSIETVLALLDSTDATVSSLPPLIVECSSEPSLWRVQFGLIEGRYRDLALAMDKLSRALRLMVNCITVVEPVQGYVRGLSLDGDNGMQELSGTVRVHPRDRRASLKVMEPVLPHLQSLCQSVSRCLMLCSVLLSAGLRDEAATPAAPHPEKRRRDGAGTADDSTPVPSSVTQEPRREASRRECLPCFSLLLRAWRSWSRRTGSTAHRQPEVIFQQEGEGPVDHEQPEEAQAGAAQTPGVPSAPGVHNRVGGHEQRASVVLLASWFRRRASAIGSILPFRRAVPPVRDSHTGVALSDLQVSSAAQGGVGHRGALQQGSNTRTSGRPDTIVRTSSANMLQAPEEEAVQEGSPHAGLSDGTDPPTALAADVPSLTSAHVELPLEIEHMQSCTAAFIHEIERSMQRHVKSASAAQDESSRQPKGATISASEAMRIHTLGFALQQASGSTLLIARLARRIAHATRQGIV